MGMPGVAVQSVMQPQSAWCAELLAGSVRVSGGEGCVFAFKSQATNQGSKEEGRWVCVELLEGRACSLSPPGVRNSWLAQSGFRVGRCVGSS